MIKMARRKKIKNKPLCKDCRDSILNLLDEYKIINLESQCRRKNTHYKCQAIHEAKDEFIEELTMWIINSSWEAGDLRR